MTTVTSVWRLRDFRRLWGAGAAAGLGAEIGELALPVLALATLGASALELSLVRMALLAPYLVLTLWLGVVVDRMRRRPLLIGTDLARGLLLAAVAALALSGWLTVPALVAAAALLGSLTVLYTLAEFSFTPSVVGETRLIDANAATAATQSALGIAGAGVGGVLVQVLTAPVAVLANAVGYLASAALLSRLRVEEPRRRAHRGSAVREARDGLVALARHPALRALVGEAAIWNLGNEVFLLAVTVLVVDRFELGAAVLGGVLMAGGAGAVAGSALSAGLTRRFGYGRSLVAAMLLGNSAPLVAVVAVAPLVPEPGIAAIAVLVAGFAMSGFGIGVANSQAVSLRQLAVDSSLRGRANASYRLVSWGALSLGALAGGAAVTLLGAVPAAMVGAGTMALATAPVALSSVRRAVSIEAAARRDRAPEDP